MLKLYQSSSPEREKQDYYELIATVDDVPDFIKHTLRDSAGGHPSYGYSLGDISKPCVVIDGSIHNLHEWKSSYGLLDMMRVLQNPSLYPDEQETIERLKEKYRFYFIPVLSPDSYVNRRDYNANFVPVNLNFEPFWDVTIPISGNKGEYPFSEPESQNLRDIVLGNSTAIYINNHTVGNDIDLMMIRPSRVATTNKFVNNVVDAVDTTYAYTGKRVRLSELNNKASSYNWAETQSGYKGRKITSFVFEPGHGLSLDDLMSVATYGMFNLINDIDEHFAGLDSKKGGGKFFIAHPHLFK